MLATVGGDEFRFAEPLSERQRKAAEDWVRLCADGGCPLAWGPEWSEPFITTDGSLVFDRPAGNDLPDIAESFHWGYGGVTLAHHFRISIGCVRASVEVRGDRSRALIVATNIRTFLQTQPVLAAAASAKLGAHHE